MKKFLLLVLIQMSLCMCSKTGRVEIPDNDLSPYQAGEKYVDEYGNEGIIIISDKEKVLAMSLDEAVLSWGRNDTSLFPVEKLFENLPVRNKSEYCQSLFLYSSGVSLDMMQIVEKEGFSDYPAFKWCDDKNRDGHPIHSSSWCLPGYYEYYLAFSSVGVDFINDALAKNGGTVIDTTAMFWTSVEDIDSLFIFSDKKYSNLFNQSKNAIAIDYRFRSFTDRANWDKRMAYHVRAFKYLYYNVNQEEVKTVDYTNIGKDISINSFTSVTFLNQKDIFDEGVNVWEADLFDENTSRLVHFRFCTALDVNSPEGTYKIDKFNYKSGIAIRGWTTLYHSERRAHGTYYCSYDENGQIDCYSCGEDGTISISKNTDGNYTISSKWKDVGGLQVTSDYDGPVSIISQ